MLIRGVAYLQMTCHRTSMQTGVAASDADRPCCATTGRARWRSSIGMTIADFDLCTHIARAFARQIARLGWSGSTDRSRISSAR